MSIIGFLLKPKKAMAKKNTKPIRLKEYIVTSHAQNRTVDTSRHLNKRDMLINLFGKESQNSNIYMHDDGTIQYDRVNDNNRTITHIVNKTSAVKSINKFHDTPRAKRQAHKNFQYRG